MIMMTTTTTKMVLNLSGLITNTSRMYLDF